MALRTTAYNSYLSGYNNKLGRFIVMYDGQGFNYKKFVFYLQVINYLVIPHLTYVITIQGASRYKQLTQFLNFKNMVLELFPT